MSATYRLKLVRGDSQFEAEGDKKFVLDMLSKHWMASSVPIPPRDAPAPQPKSTSATALPISAGKKMSAGEFIRQLGFKKHTDIVLAFGYFLEKMSGLTSFTAADINACYYEAKLETSNTSQMIIQNMHTGRIMLAKKATDKGRAAYVLTRTGEEFVEKKPAKPEK
jgi:hypothetical protein